LLCHQGYSELGHSLEHVGPALAYQGSTLGEPDGGLEKCSPEGVDISAQSSGHSELQHSPGLGVQDCSELGESQGLWVAGCSALRDSLCREDCSKLGGSLGLGVVDCSVLGESPREPVASPGGYRECPLGELLGFAQE